MRKPVAIAACATGWLLLTAGSCATTSEPQVITKTVEVPVAVKCAADVPAPPAYPDTDAALKAAPDLFARVRLLVAGRLERIAREAQLSAALGGCTGQTVQ